jgi:diguanylate cyclase (GGDEF)-like protein/PAS domain S-box-containing protein
MDAPGKAEEPRMNRNVTGPTRGRQGLTSTDGALRSTQPLDAQTAPRPLARRQVFTPLPPPHEQPDGGTFVVDATGTVLSFDHHMERLTGWRADDVVGRSKALGFSPSLRDAEWGGYVSRPLFDGELPRTDEPRVVALSMHAADGAQLEVETRIVPLGQRDRLYAIEVLRVLARHGRPDERREQDEIDAMTGLPNAHAFQDVLARSFAVARTQEQPLSVLLVELDAIEALREEHGDETFRQIVRRLGSLLEAETRPSDFVAHLHQGRFGIVSAARGRSDTRHGGGQLRALVERFFAGKERTGAPARATVSIGVACYPAEGATPRDLLRRAEEALDEAHRLGNNRVWCYVRRPRVAARVPVFLDGPAPRPLGFSRDLSPSGVFVATDERLSLGLRVALALHVGDDEEAVRAVGRVTRRDDGEGGAEAGRGVGIEFESLREGDRTRLERFLHDVREGQGEE